MTLTDIGSSVDSAFQEMECVVETMDHGGDKAGYFLGHGCWPDGFMCADHMKRCIERKLPALAAKLAQQGYIRCSECARKFPTVDSFMKIIPL